MCIGVSAVVIRGSCGTSVNGRELTRNSANTKRCCNVSSSVGDFNPSAISAFLVTPIIRSQAPPMWGVPGGLKTNSGRLPLGSL